MSSEVEDELTHEKFKLPKKISSDSHPVNSACVPRKLRSVISKRDSESVASVSWVDPKRRKYSLKGGESFRTDCMRTSKDGCPERLPIPAISMLITKEEEEVAETLFALAGIIPLKGDTVKEKTIGSTKNKLDEPISSSKDPVIGEGKLETACNHSSGGSENVLAAAESSPSISAHSKSLIETATVSCSKLSERRQLSRNLKVSVPPAPLQTIHQLLRPCDERKLGDSASMYQMATVRGWQSRFNETKLENVLLHSWQAQQRVSSQSLDMFSNLEREHATSSERRGFTSRPLLESGVDQLSIESSGMVFPSWLHTAASSSRPALREDTLSGDKVPSSTVGSRKSWKRCIAHVHISRLIQVLQKSEEKDKVPLDVSQLRLSQCSSIHPEQNEIKENLTGHMFGSVANSDWKTGVRPPMNVQHRMDTELGSKKRSFNFYSMSSGAERETNNGAGRLNICLDAPNHVPPLHSLAHTSAPLPCSTPANPFPSNAYGNQIAVASMALPSVPHQVHLQMAPYFANAFGPTHMSHISNASSTQSAQPKYQEQQQQKIWAAQLAAQFRPGHLLPSQTANWQNRRQDLWT